MVNTLDIRTLASEWRELQEEFDEARAGVFSREFISEANQKYEDLCDELGADHDPDGLEVFGNYYEPTLIAESDFEEYAQELANELGDLPPSRWPYYCIDWEYAARELAHDYTTVTYDGVDYKIRSW